VVSGRIKLVIDSGMENVPLVGVAINKLCSLAQFSDEDNSIKHAYGNEPGHEVEVIYSIGSDELVLDIYDTGRPMDQDLLKEADISSLYFDANDFDSVPEKGRGLAIIKEIMDSASYTSSEGKNCFTMKKKLPSGS
jgi:serine/threonine-protein kinase RsbW